MKVSGLSGGEVPLNLTTWCLEQVGGLPSHTPSPAYAYVLQTRPPGRHSIIVVTTEMRSRPNETPLPPRR